MTGQGSIRVEVNGTYREVPKGLSVCSFLEHLELNPSLVVVEKNRAILDRNRYGEEPVESGDSFELVHFVGGG